MPPPPPLRVCLLLLGLALLAEGLAAGARCARSVADRDGRPALTLADLRCGPPPGFRGVALRTAAAGAVAAGFLGPATAGILGIPAVAGLFLEATARLFPPGLPGIAFAVLAGRVLAFGGIYLLLLRLPGGCFPPIRAGSCRPSSDSSHDDQGNGDPQGPGPGPGR